MDDAVNNPQFERRQSKPRAREGRYRMLRKMFVSEFVEAIFAALVVAAVLRFFVVAVYRVPSESMMPALLPGDFIVASKTSYGIQIPFSNEKIGRRDPARGEVVVFRLPDDDVLFIKRVVGIAGDKIEIRDGRLFVNDVSTTVPIAAETGDWDVAEESVGGLTHRVISRKARAEADSLAPLIVLPGQVFLLGDLRSDSVDSRHWGPLPTSLVFARATFVAFSLRIPGRPAWEEKLSSTEASKTPEAGLRFGRIFKSIE